MYPEHRKLPSLPLKWQKIDRYYGTNSGPLEYHSDYIWYKDLDKNLFFKITDYSRTNVVCDTPVSANLCHAYGPFLSAPNSFATLKGAQDWCEKVADLLYVAKTPT